MLEFNFCGKVIIEIKPCQLYFHMVLVCFSLMEFGGRSSGSIDHQEEKIIESPKRTKSRMPRN